ncbi:histidine kinase [bacterium]|nr:histidine kinase [bacterium]
MNRSKWLVLLGICTFLGLLSFSIAYTEERLDGESTPFYYPLIYELTGAYGVFVLLPPVLWFMERYPVTRLSWYRAVPFHILMSVLFGVTHTLLMTLSRMAIYAVVALGTYKLGDPFFRFIMEYQKQFLIYAAILIGHHLVRQYQANREREHRTAELELQAEQLKAKFAEAQLQTLKGQIQPHFLFNTLNMISSTMYEDVGKADRLMTRVSGLLRLTLEQSGKEKIALRQELDFMYLYFEIMKARFEEKFHFHMSIDRETENALVPNLVLQPFVENAIKHNESEVIELEIKARRDGKYLVLQVCDNGPGLREPDPYLKGIGLANTRDRLRHLYRTEQALSFENRPGGGLIVTIQVPFEEEPSMQPL